MGRAALSFVFQLWKLASSVQEQDEFPQLESKASQCCNRLNKKLAQLETKGVKEERYFPTPAIMHKACSSVCCSSRASVLSDELHQPCNFQFPKGNMERKLWLSKVFSRHGSLNSDGCTIWNKTLCYALHALVVQARRTSFSGLLMLTQPSYPRVSVTGKMRPES